MWLVGLRPMNLYKAITILNIGTSHSARRKVHSNAVGHLENRIKSLEAVNVNVVTSRYVMIPNQTTRFPSFRLVVWMLHIKVFNEILCCTQTEMEQKEQNKIKQIFLEPLGLL